MRRTTAAAAINFLTLAVIVGARVTSGAAPQISAAPTPSANWSYHPAWTAPATALVGRASSDGRFIAFKADGDLMVHDLTTGADRRLTTDDKRGNASGTLFSRDGQQIVYDWHAGNRVELRVIDLRATGTPQPRTLINDPDIEGTYQGDWSPDGKWIAIEISRNDGHAQLALVSVADGSLRVLKSFDRFGPQEMAFSKDGQYLAYDVLAAGPDGHEVFVRAVDSGSETVAVAGPSEDSLIGWLPDSGLLFSSGRSGATDLWAQPMSGGMPQGKPMQLNVPIPLDAVRIIGLTETGALFTIPYRDSPTVTVAALDFRTGRLDAHPLDRGSEEGFWWPDWSPDGKSLAYIVRPPRKDPTIVIRSVNTDRIERILAPALVAPYSLKWTPDAKALVVTGSSARAAGDLWLVDASTSQVSSQPLERSGTDFSPVEWRMSEDGATFSYFGLRRTAAGNEAVFIRRDVASGREREIFATNHARGLQVKPINRIALSEWLMLSADASKLYYSVPIASDNQPPFEEFAFVERVLSSGAEREITRGCVGGIHLSPDERYIATAINDQATMTRSINIVPVSGGPVRRVMSVPLPVPATAANFHVVNIETWAPDGRSLVVRKTLDAARSELWWVPLDGRAPVLVNVPPAMSVRVHPDGHFVFRNPSPRASVQQSVLVLEHFLPVGG